MKTPMSNEAASAGIFQQCMNERFRESEEQGERLKKCQNQFNLFRGGV